MSKSKEYRKSLILLQTAVMMFGMSGVIGKAVTAPALMITGGRVICSSLLLLAALLIKRISIRAVDRADSVITFIAGILLAVHWYSFFLSVKLASVAIGTLTFSSFPLFLLFLEPLLYHEKICKKNIFLAIFLVIGVLITVPEFSLTNHSTEGILWGMLCSLCYALITLCNRKLSSHYCGAWISFREQSAAAIVLLPVIILNYQPVSASDLVGISAIGIICTALAFSIYVAAQKSVTAQTAGIASGMETVYGILFAAVFLHEYPSISEYLGGIIIFSVVIISSLCTDSPNDRQETDITI